MSAVLREAHEALKFVDRLYSTKGGVINPEQYGLIANSDECGKMINAVRDAISHLETPPSLPEAVAGNASAPVGDQKNCHAGSDGDCNWSECPQLKEHKVICPLWKENDDE